MPLSRVEERRWFSRVLLTRLPHNSLNPHSLHVCSSPHISTLHPLNIHLHRLLFLTFHLLLAPFFPPLSPLLIFSSLPPLSIFFSIFHLRADPLCSCPHPSPSPPPFPLSVYCFPTSLLLLLLYFPDVFTPLAHFHCLMISSPLVPKRHLHC